MSPYFIFVFVFNLAITRSNGDASHPPFTSCSTPASCGAIVNISYPFWGVGRPSFCGRPEFQLLCPTNSTYPSILIGTNAYRVLKIDSENQTITLAGEEFILTNTTCAPVPLNYTLNDTLFSFNNRNDVVNITFLYQYQCPHPQSIPNDTIISRFNCLSSAAIVYNDNRFGIGCNGTRIEVSVFSEALKKLKNNTETLFGVLNEGFTVGYKMDVQACHVCKNSGGACGSSLQSSAEFVCYCPHGAASAIPCSAGESDKKESDKKKIFIGVGSGILGSMIIICALYLFHLHRCKKHLSSTDTMQQYSRNLPSIFNPYIFSNLENRDNYLGVNLFSYTELEEATKHFSPSKELGDGGFGTVYHGKLGDGREVAIKRLYENNPKRVQQFVNETKILAHLRHKNLVTLYGCTSHHGKELLLVYEYVPNGTVADHLYSHNNSTLEKLDSKFSYLPWRTRVSIATETASALVYLHASVIVHRDVKTNNILLDNNFTVKVADFGLSRLFPLDVTHVSTAPQGTPGYVDPEYHQCYHLTDKSDVYSFGVVLIELISSKPAVDMTRHRHEINLSNLAINMIRNDMMHELVDPSLGFDSDSEVKEEVMEVAELAFRCLQHDGELRPTMEEVREVLSRMQERRNEYVVDDKMKKGDENKYIGVVYGDVVDVLVSKGKSSDCSSAHTSHFSSSTSTSHFSC